MEVSSEANKTILNRQPEICIEINESVERNNFFDRLFTAGVGTIVLLTLSGVVWLVSKLFDLEAFYLEELAVVLFIVTLVCFASFGLLGMCVMVCKPSKSLRELDGDVELERSGQSGKTAETLCESVITAL